MDSSTFQDLPEESAEDLYENAPCGYISFLTDGTIFKLNSTLLDMLGYQKEDVVKKKKLIDLFRIGGKIYFETHFFPLVKMQGFVKEINFDLVRKDGSYFPALINVDQVTNPKANNVVYRASILDISDRKKYEKVLIEAREKAERATRAKAEFLSTISHEIRTPLNAIVGIGNLFDRTPLDNIQREYSKILRASSGNLLELVNNLLDLSKLEAQKVKLEKRSFDLKELLEVLVHTFKIRAEEKKLRLEADLPTNLPHHLLGDPVKLNQVLTNLLGNAIKFTNSGYVKLRILVISQELKDIHLKFIIEDSGIGIPKDKLDVIFQEFSQASYDVSLEFGGTGLGLNISQKLLKMHESELKVESEEGKGSIFSFELNYKLSSHANMRNKKRAVTEILRKSAAKILVVDDNTTNLFIISEYLQGWGLDHTTVSSGNEAIEAFKREPFDVVLMDLHMPRMDGYEASAKINELNLDFKPAIIALSASGRGDVNFKMKRSGIDAYVPKPFDPLELQEVIISLLNRGGAKHLQELKMNDDPVKASFQEILNADKQPSYNVSRYLNLAAHNPIILNKLIRNAVESLYQFRDEFKTAVVKESHEMLGELIHKNTMTLHYIEAQGLTALLNDCQEYLQKGDMDPHALNLKKGLVMDEFEKVISGLESYQLNGN